MKKLTFGYPFSNFEPYLQSYNNGSKVNKNKCSTSFRNKISKLGLWIGILLVFPMLVSGQKIEPVTPNASPETKALLEYLQGLSGKYTLSGQHNFPISRDRNTQFAADYIGKTPIVWSQDFGFSKDGDKDSFLARPSIVQEAIRQHKLGAIINLCWHAVPPTADEPVTFQPLPGADPNKLASVQGRLTEQQFHDLLTPGTDIYKQWLKQVDEIAGFLKQLETANVPVVWRPYHEMNGDWFWWGGRFEGKYTTAALYRQIFDRMVKYHKLKNLIWVWSVDRPSQPGREFIKYYPGNEYLDILAIDIYGNDFSQKYYEGLMLLSKGKPVTLAEVGNPPSQEVLKNQPNWIYWVVWAGMVGGTATSDYQKLVNDSKVLFFEDQAYINSTIAFRKACGFDSIVIDKTANFSGDWKMNEQESVAENMGLSSAPYKLSITQNGIELKVKYTTAVEWADDEITDQMYYLDGRDLNSTVFNNSPRLQNANLSTKKDSLTIDSKITITYGDRTSELKSKEIWTTQRRGKRLIIFQTADGFMGRPPRTSKLVYDKL